MSTTVEVPTEKWSGQVREATLGATAEEGGTRSHTVTVGGENTLPFLTYEGETPHPPVLALEIADRKPEDWSPLLLDTWGEAANDPAAWAEAAQTQGADLILLRFTLPQGGNGASDLTTHVRQVLRRVLEATGLPLLVFGPGQVEADNDICVAAAEEGAGERLVLGVCEDKNYRPIAAAALAHGHLVNSRTAMDVNLAKQLVILIREVGLPLERILLDPTTGALGYGMEYGYSVMERLRLAALQGDSMTQQPMLVTPGEEAWRVKETKVGEGVPAAWGDWEERSIAWEMLTASTLAHAGANILVLRHPESLRRLRKALGALVSVA